MASHPKVCILAWDGMDLLDFVGPIEVLSHVKDNTANRLAIVTVAAEHSTCKTNQNLIITRDLSIEEVLARLHEFDVLIVPGGGGFAADSIPDRQGIKSAVKAFSQLQERQKPHILMSICAGVFFLADEGLLKGKTVTGHYASLGELQKLCNAKGGSKVVRQHYVDCGIFDGNGMEIITSGGISSGIDATLYLIEKIWGLDKAEKARATMDAVWRREALPAGF